jgi:hypothetical protein
MKWIEHPGTLLTELRVEQREPKVEVSVDTPASIRVDEQVRINVSVTNREAESIRLVAAFQCLQSQDSGQADSEVDFYLEGGAPQRCIHVDFGEVAVNATSNASFVISASLVGSRTFKGALHASLVSSGVRIERNSASEFDLTAAELLVKPICQTLLSVIPLFDVSTAVARLPEPPLATRSIAGPLGLQAGATLRTDRWTLAVAVKALASVHVKSVGLKTVLQHKAKSRKVMPGTVCWLIDVCRLGRARLVQLFVHC